MDISAGGIVRVWVSCNQPLGSELAVRRCTRRNGNASVAARRSTASHARHRCITVSHATERRVCYSNRSTRCFAAHVIVEPIVEVKNWHHAPRWRAT